MLLNKEKVNEGIIEVCNRKKMAWLMGTAWVCEIRSFKCGNCLSYFCVVFTGLAFRMR